MKNTLKEFYEFMEDHRNFYVDVTGDVLVNSADDKSHDKKPERVYESKMTCNKLSLEMFETKVEIVTTKAIAYMKAVAEGKRVWQRSSLLLEPDVKKVRTLLVDPFKEGEKAINLKMWVDPRLGSNPFCPSPDDKQLIDKCMKLQLKNIDLVLKEYSNIIMQFQN